MKDKKAFWDGGFLSFAVIRDILAIALLVVLSWKIVITKGLCRSNYRATLT